jgi:hypothetical protein
MKNLLMLLICITILSYTNVFGQKVNPDLENIPIKNKLQTVYKTDNVVNFKHVKAAIDSKGNLYAVFHNPYNGNAYFATNKSGQWETEELITRDENGYDASYPAIEIDKSDNIHVVFTRHPSALIYSTKKVSDSKWTFTEINNDDTPELLKFYVWQDYIDMCTDDKGGVHLIISGDGRDLQEKVFDMAAIYFYKPANGKWENELIKRGITDTYNGYGTDPSIVTYKNDVFVTFGGKNSINFAQKTIGGNIWSIEQIKIDDDINGGKQNTSLCLFPDGTPAFAYRDLFGGDDYAGLNVVTKHSCTGDWYIDNIGNMKNPAIGVDNDGVIYLAYEHNPKGVTFAYRSCSCEQTWKNVFNDYHIYSDFIDMIIDDNNHVHVLYTSEKEVKHAEFWFDGNPQKECNYRPSISFKGKTNVKPGEEWACTIYASDPECNPVEIYSIILPDNFKLTDHGNGTATLKGTMEEGEGFGDIPFVILCNDDKHPGANAKQSKVAISLRLTQKGIEKGSIKYENNCSPEKSTVVKTSTSSTQGQSTPPNKQEADGSNQSNADNKLNTEQSKTCKEYLDRYEAWANKYIPLKKEVNENPMNMQAVMKLAEMAPEIGNWGLEWSQKHECSNDPAFVERFEKISDRIDEVNK